MDRKRLQQVGVKHYGDLSHIQTRKLTWIPKMTVWPFLVSSVSMLDFWGVTSTFGQQQIPCFTRDFHQKVHLQPLEFETLVGLTRFTEVARNPDEVH